MKKGIQKRLLDFRRFTIVSSFVFAMMSLGLVESGLALNLPERIDLTTIQADGTEKQQDLLDRSGQKFLFVEFFSTTCGPCHRNLPRVQKVFESHSAKLTVRTIGIDRDADAVRVYVQAHRAEMGWEVAMDPTRVATRAFQVRATPTQFLVNDKNEIVKSWEGTLSDEDLTDIAQLIQE